MAADAEGASNSGSDSAIGRSAVDAGFVTPAELQAALSRRNKLRGQGKYYKLTDILVKTGLMTASQLKRLPDPAEDSATQSLQKLPGFQIMQKVGAGAMASVYKARQLSLDRLVAVKVLPKRFSEDPEFVERFYKEGKAAAKLNHNNIVQAIDVGEYAGYHYFVMEFVDGNTVYDEMIQHRVYQESDALDIIIQIAKALKHAHERGLIHRDVKPKNIMITKDSTAKLADMGLARQADDAAVAAAEKGRAFGTPYYISPEQIRGVLDVDFRTDIYSLGATFYHMVTGKVPFEGSTPTSIMQKHLKQTLVPPDHINKALSTGLAEVIEHMMIKDRSRRYLSTSELLVDLERVRRGEAPLQARTGVDDSLLENLAQGSQEDFLDGSGAYNLQAPTTAATRASPGLIAAVVLEAVVIVVLILALVF